MDPNLNGATVAASFQTCADHTAGKRVKQSDAKHSLKQITVIATFDALRHKHCAIIMYLKPFSK